MTTRVTKWAVPALAALGLVDAGYLSILHWQGEAPPCWGYAGCAQVNSSVYATIFGVPVAALGGLLYIVLLSLGIWRLLGSKLIWPYSTLLLNALTLAATVFMGYLTGVELFVLRALCYWCLGMAAISLLLLALTLWDSWSFASKADGWPYPDKPN